MKPYKFYLISGRAQVNTENPENCTNHSIDFIAGKIRLWATAVVISNVIHVLKASTSQNFG